MQPVSMYFTMDRVDLVRLSEWAKTTDDVPARAIPKTVEGLDYGLWLTGFNKSLRAWQEKTGVKLQRDNITLKTADSRMYVNGTRVTNVDVFDPVQFTNAVLECYRQIEGVARYLRETIPGFEKARIEAIAPVLGVRETRHVVGEYTLSGKDSIEGTHFEDSIAADASALDIHDPKGADVDFQGLRPYEIPYRALLPWVSSNCWWQAVASPPTTPPMRARATCPLAWLRVRRPGWRPQSRSTRASASARSRSQRCSRSSARSECRFTVTRSRERCELHRCLDDGVPALVDARGHSFIALSPSSSATRAQVSNSRARSPP